MENTKPTFTDTGTQHRDYRKKNLTLQVTIVVIHIYYCSYDFA